MRKAKSHLGIHEVVVATQMALKVCERHKIDPETIGISKEKYQDYGYTEKDFVSDSLENVKELLKRKSRR